MIQKDDKSLIEFSKDFTGVKVFSNDSETTKKIVKLAKEHKMFLLCSHSGVKYFISESQANVDSFKKSIASL